MIRSKTDTVLKEIKIRRSPVSFSNELIPEADMNLLFEAARWAPSSYNQQPWRFIFATREDNDAYQRLFELLVPANQEWAVSAPVLMLSVAEIIPENRSKENRFAFHDLGMAVGNLLIQATSMGIYVHQMGGYDVEKARKDMLIPDRYEPAAMFALGYPGEVDSLPMELKRRELAKRTRNEISTFAFKNSWKSI